MGRRPGIDGRELLLAAALKLFAEQGVDGVSIRAVNREAGLGPASVHYHFGTKEALVDAVLHEYGDAVIEGVKGRAKEIAASETPPDARGLVTLLAEPYLDLVSSTSHTGQDWLRLVAQLLQQDPGLILDRPSGRLIWSAAATVFPDASTADVQRTMRMCLTLLITQLAQARRAGRNTLDIDLLVDFLAAGLDAVLGQPTAAVRLSSA